MLVSKCDITGRAIGSGGAAAPRLADWLSLAAAPTFLTMALLTSASGGGAADMMCSAAHASPLGGMVPMYLLMSAFHLAPWLRLITKARNSVEAAVSRDIAPTNS
jgi:hypothetical protein